MRADAPGWRFARGDPPPMAGSREDTAPGAGRAFHNAKTDLAPQ